VIWNPSIRVLPTAQKFVGWVVARSLNESNLKPESE
jgi:hypothetical protein